MKHRTHLLATALLAASAAAHAAPFATTHHGTIGPSSIPGANVGEPYSITLIMDNQGNSANGQTWTQQQLTCALLRFNTGATASLTVDLAASPPTHLTNELQTSATGVMTRMFAELAVYYIQAGQYSVTGLALQPPFTLRGASADDRVLSYGGGANPLLRVSDAAGGVNMSPGGWSSPIAVAGACDDTPLAPLPQSPGSPTGATAQAGNGQVTVSWQAPVGSAAPLSYTAYTYGNDGFARACTVDHPVTSCTVTGLVNDQPYTFVVTAAAPRSRPSAPSNQVTATPRATPNPGPGPGNVQAVPALGLPALALLGSGAAGLGAMRLRRRRAPGGGQ